MLGKEYFLKVYNEENMEQADGTPNAEVIVDKPVDEGKPTEPIVETPPVVKPVETPTPVESPKKDVFTIDGEEVTIDVIKEWKQGNMRQSDYTRKTQELAKQKKELEELRAKKDSDEGIIEKSPELERIEKIEFELASKQLDLEITSLKQKYPDFDEVKVLNECDKRGIYNDLEFVYKALRDENTKQTSEIDVEKIKQQAIEEYKNTIALELAKDKEATSGSIISSAPGQPPVDHSASLTSEEKEFCRKRGWTAEYYAKMKDTEYKI